MTDLLPTLDDILAAAARIRPHVHRAPVLTSATFDALIGAKVFFKCENLQKTGAFKIRGAANAVFSLSEQEAAAGVATHSSGNHGAALAKAAAERGVPAHIVMPERSSEVKKRAVAGYGGKIYYCGASVEDRDRRLREVVARSGAVVVHPYNDLRIIAGQGTAALELLEEVPELNIVMAPIGGGGLIAGTAVSVKSRSPETRVIGAEPAGADDAWRSLQAGELRLNGTPDTIADGLRATLGDLTFPLIKRHVSAIERVSEPGIIDAMRWVWERMKLVVEPSAAVPVAALMEGELDVAKQRIGVILSGGNVDLDALPWRA